MGDSKDEAQTILYSCVSIGLVLLAGLMSGLTLGLMSLDSVDLEVRHTFGSDQYGDACRSPPIVYTADAGPDSLRNPQREKVCS